MNLKKLLFILVLAAIVGYLVAFALDLATENDAHFVPTYDKQNIKTNILDWKHLNGSDYQLLLQQTGLGKDAVDQILAQGGTVETFLPYQATFFESVRVKCNDFMGIVGDEFVCDEHQNPVHAFELAPIQKGDVLLSFGSHLAGWRKGYAGIVVDAEKKLVLEANTLTGKSELVSIEHWMTYPSFALLRFNGAPASSMEFIYDDAKENLVGKKYSPFAGMIGSKFDVFDKLKKTYAAHLVWEVFRSAGFDIDSDGGSYVTVDDILECSQFDIVQLYGIDPKELRR